MDESYYLGAYWRARNESASECAARAVTLFSLLPKVDPSLAQWFRQSKSRKDATKNPIASDHAELERRLRRTKDRHFEDLGFRLSGWNGAPEDADASSFDAAVGIYSEWVGNFWLFELPSRGPVAERLLTGKVLSELLRATAIAWEPDWGVAMSHAHREMVGDRHVPKSPYVGGVTYLARHLGVVPPLPAPVRIEPVEDKGTLVILTPERFTASNPEHVALAERVRELLDRAGLLKPL
ncbi:immunity 52 family protein [Myxococcus qinghaiensis]|uniref:immunity 52 family protein n=1 Tax=Myxococcus qinghaiensis TaxID=2906758 RepID=UPI0020A6F0B6|nr:immunity 52 family protein [Myxococcus qinghaiensis]MCP3163349.1 immunity 52 family protein [Myxococcus qinghaiensis]